MAMYHYVLWFMMINNKLLLLVLFLISSSLILSLNGHIKLHLPTFIVLLKADSSYTYILMTGLSCHNHNI